MIAEVFARSSRDHFLEAWLGECSLGWAADLIADLTNVIPQTVIPTSQEVSS